MFRNTIKKSITISVFLMTFSLILFAQTTEKERGMETKSSNAKTQSAGSTTGGNTKPKKRVVVVLNFDDASLTKENQKIEMGRQIAIKISNEFATRGDFEVVERANIDQIIKEQDTSYDSRRDPKLAAKISQLMSASSVVIGSITEYTMTSKTSSVLGVMTRTITAKVGLAVRLVDVNTGQVQDSVTVNGKQEKKERIIGGLGGEMTDLSEDLKTQLLTEAAEFATKDAVNKLEKLIDKNARASAGADVGQSSTSSTKPAEEKEKERSGLSKLNPFGRNKDKKETTSSNPQPAPPPPPVSTVTAPATPGKIIAVLSDKIILSGVFQNAKVGTQLLVYRVIKEHPDPDNPKIIAFVETADVAKIEIIEIQPNGISAKVISGSGLKTGDLVKLP